MNCNHTIHKDWHHFGWDNSIEPALSVGPGETVEISAVDSSGGQLTPDSTVNDLATLSFDKVNPVTGAIFIEGVAPGDAVALTFPYLKPSGWGWTANIPGFGLLADQFPDPRCMSGHITRPPYRLPPTAREVVFRLTHDRNGWLGAARVGGSLGRAAAAHGWKHGHSRQRYWNYSLSSCRG
tara:strand:+ start:497 stop:1039 length:543 start_codon:yes stop_codon:yes gene_type:complete